MNWLKFLPDLFRLGNDVQTKGWYASRTIWFNVLVLALGVYSQAAGSELPVAGEELEAVAIALSVIGNIVLRIVTDKPVGMRTVRRPEDPDRPGDSGDQGGWPVDQDRL